MFEDCKAIVKGCYLDEHTVNADWVPQLGANYVSNNAFSIF